MPDIKDILDEQKIVAILKKTGKPTAKKVSAILRKAEKKKGLGLEEIGWLVNTSDKKLIEQMFKTAGKIKNEIYGERIVFFAPLYISSYCVNDCDYCGFHTSNSLPRKKLTLKEVAKQVRVLEDMGHKRLLLEFGEHSMINPIDYVIDVIKTIYGTKSKNGSIRRVNVNIAATTVEDYRKLKAVGIGTYQLFQETYHYDTYQKLHRGPKADYERQLFAHDRAFEAGIDDIGLGVLFGLYDYRFEVLGLISHAQYLEKKYGVGPHTLSVPRFQPAQTVNMQVKYAVSENELLKIIAILRMAVPYTGMIISTRERPEIRKKAFKIGISQASAASVVEVGGYKQKFPISNFKFLNKDKKQRVKKQDVVKQFNTQDERSLDEIIESICKEGWLPSFCTACYRQGRTGKTFMHFAKPGEIQNLCRPNAILTFQEYLNDYASAKSKKLGKKIIEKYLKQIPNSSIKKETEERLKKINKGERDLYF